MTETISAAQYRQTKPKKSKYGNVKVMIDGLLFDSKAEANYYSNLKIRERAGEVGGVELQRSFAILGPKGELICTFRADFCFIDHCQDSRFRCIDVKGFATPVFRLKKKLMKAFLQIDVETVA